jgi:hypothetical protein
MLLKYRLALVSKRRLSEVRNGLAEKRSRNLGLLFDPGAHTATQARKRFFSDRR